MLSVPVGSASDYSTDSKYFLAIGLCRRHLSALRGHQCLIPFVRNANQCEVSIGLLSPESSDLNTCCQSKVRMIEKKLRTVKTPHLRLKPETPIHKHSSFSAATKCQRHTSQRGSTMTQSRQRISISLTQPCACISALYRIPLIGGERTSPT